ncbi:PD-(D/E)XK nuclease family protein [Alkalibacter mobilis]|uniref:PD-(D/E)XK nuclease family protein n=1 Tax=Alkalibacter mobilis TaxID=2787712 RepID=UPI00189CF815|nr:PD-(D/E)XK nuclease family protein [Alkalibacter mobilis]MBF7096020.1 PD-(D/E)XK nuclease family protein [Alkalibacter mobilis]
MLEILIGKNGSGKIKEMYKQIRESLNNGEENLMLIVPDQYTLEAEKELMETLELQGVFRLEVISFSRLVENLSDESFEPEKAVVTSTGKKMIIKKILRNLKDDLKIFGAMTNKNGFVDDVENMIRTFKENMIEIESVPGIDENSDPTGILDRKLHDMHMIMNAYEKYLGNGFIDTEGKINKAIEKAKGSEYIKKSKIWINGFHTFTGQINELIITLAMNAKKVSVILDLYGDESDPTREIYEINKNTLEKFKNAQVEIKIGAFESENTKLTDINHLKNEFFSYPFAKYSEKPENIKLTQSQNVYREIDNVCTEITRLTRDQGYKYKDIGVISNDLTGYGFLIKRTFEEYGMSCFLDVKRSVSDKPLSLFIASSLKSLANNFRYDDVFSMIKSGFTKLTWDRYEILENYCLRFGIKGKQWLEDFYKNDSKMSYDLEELNQMRKEVITPLETFREKIKKNPTYAHITTALFEYMEENKCMEKTNALSSDLVESGDLEHSAENKQIFNKIIDLMDEIVEIFGNEKTGIKEYTDVISSGLESAELGILPSYSDEIVVGDVKRSRQNSIKVLFIVGLNEGVLPGEISEGGLFTSLEMKEMEEKGKVNMRDDRRYQSVQERYLFNLLLGQVENKIYFSYPLADFEGNSLRPSSFAERIEEIFPEAVIEADFEEDLDLISNQEGSFRHMVAYYRKAVDSNEDPSNAYWDQVYKWYAENPAWTAITSKITDAMTWENRVPDLTEKQIKNIYGKKLKNSVTGLETYAQCPFKYFVRYGLKPRERKIYEVSIPDMGQLLHDAIQQYSEKLEELDIRWVDVEEDLRRNLCRQILAEKTESYKEGVFLSSGRYKYLGDYLARLMDRAIETLTYHLSKGEFEILKTEASFGENQSLKEVNFSYDRNMQMVLEGRIDRVDVYRDGDKTYVKIIDYKTGEKSFDLKDVYYGLSLQLLIYLGVCLEIDRGYLPAGAFYFKLDDPMIRASKEDMEDINKKIRKVLRLKGLLLKEIHVARAMDKNLEDEDVINCKIKKDGDFAKSNKGLIEEDVFKGLVEHALKSAEIMGKEIVNGNIAIEPVKNGSREACLYCEYKTICQFDKKFGGNNFRYKKALKDSEVVEMILGGGNND